MVSDEMNGFVAMKNLHLNDVLIGDVGFFSVETSRHRKSSSLI